mgnify:CR=1 FL=1
MDLRVGLTKPAGNEIQNRPQHMPTWYLVSGLVFVVFGFILLGTAWGGFMGEAMDSDPGDEIPDIPGGVTIVSILLIALGGVLTLWGIVKMASEGK